MSFVKTLKKALGFSDSEMEEEELEGIDARVTPLRSRSEKDCAISQEEQPAVVQPNLEETGICRSDAQADAVAKGDIASEKNITPDAI